MITLTFIGRITSDPTPTDGGCRFHFRSDGQHRLSFLVETIGDQADTSAPTLTVGDRVYLCGKTDRRRKAATRTDLRIHHITLLKGDG